MKKKNPTLRKAIASQANTSEEQILSSLLSSRLIKAYDIVNSQSRSSASIPKKLQSLRTSAARTVGPERQVALNKYKQALEDYKAKNPDFDVTSLSKDS
jgi:hypothetical protein